MEALRFKMEPWRVFISVVAVSHNFNRAKGAALRRKVGSGTALQ
jgi:hypothetical protein